MFGQGWFTSLFGYSLCSQRRIILPLATHTNERVKPLRGPGCGYAKKKSTQKHPTGTRVRLATEELRGSSATMLCHDEGGLPYAETT
jgi:hypothetical protein